MSTYDTAECATFRTTFIFTECTTEWTAFDASLMSAIVSALCDSEFTAQCAAFTSTFYTTFE